MLALKHDEDNRGEGADFTLIVSEGELREIQKGLECAEIEGQCCNADVNRHLQEKIDSLELRD